MDGATSLTKSRRSPPILLLGQTGMLGRAWTKMLADAGISYYSPPRVEFDLARSESIVATMARGFQMVVNAAGYTNVDVCESVEELATVVNGSGVAILAEQCANHGATLIHYSSDYVFSGNADKPYSPSSPRNPINAYGRTKSLGDDAVERSGCDYLLVRTSWMYASWGRNFVRTIAALAAERARIRVVDDQSGRPTNTRHLAQMSWQLVQDGVRGVYHLTDGGQCTRYEWARAIVAMTRSNCIVEPCTTDQFPRPAKRPRYSVLDLTSTESLVGPMPTWRHSLQEILCAREPQLRMTT